MPALPRVVALAGLLAAPLATQQGPPATPVRTQTVTVETRAPTRDVIGALRARARARVAAVEPGRVLEARFDEGQSVSAGAVLVRIDDRRLQRDLAQAEAELAVRQAQVGIERAQSTTATADLAAWRAAEANRKGSVSEIALRAAERDAAVAAAQLLVAASEVLRSEAVVARLRIQLEDSVVRAPFDGVIVQKQIEQGEWLAAGTSVAVLVSTGTIEAWVEVPETLAAAALAHQTNLAIRIDALGLQVEPTALRVIPDVDPRSRRFTLVATLDAIDGALPGMSVVAELPGGTPRAMLRVPIDAIVNDAGGSFVYKVSTPPNGPAIAMPITIRVAFRRDGYAFCDPDGLQGGDQLVTEGNERLRPMMPIQPIPAREGAETGR